MKEVAKLVLVNIINNGLENKLGSCGSLFSLFKYIIGPEGKEGWDITVPPQFYSTGHT